MARQHEHDFNDDKSACLPVKVKLLLAPFVAQTGARWQTCFAALEKGGVNVLKDFRATEEHKEQVMSYVRRTRDKNKGAWWSGTFGALSSFKEEYEMSYSAATEKFSGKPDDTDGMHTFIVTEDSVVDAENKIIHLTGTTPHLSRNNERDSKMRFGVQKFVDGTYRVNWNGIPLIVVGVIDMRQTFHLTAWQLACSENKASLNSILKADILLADAVAEEAGFSLEEEVEHSMNDNNDASFDAVSKVLVNVKRPGNCAEVYTQLANLHKSKGEASKKKALKKAAAVKMKEYSRFATKPMDDEFCEEIKAYSFDKLRKSVSECYHLYKLPKLHRKFGPLILRQCSCPYFWHYGKCKHALGYAIYKKEVVVPAKYSIEKIGKLARKAGRPLANAKGGEALIRP
jgi:hypothetical protein